MATTVVTVTSVTKDSPGAGQVTIVASYASGTLASPAQIKTVNEFQAGNPNWSRNIRLTDDAITWVRNGVTSVAVLTAGYLSKLAIALQTGMSWAPRITTQPSAASTAFAKATLTLSGAVSNNDTVTIGNKTYTFKTALTPTEGEVLIGGSAAIALDNLKSAVNHTGTPDTDYSCAAAHTQVNATTNTDTTQLFVSKVIGTASNAYASTETMANGSFGGATFSGGLALAQFVTVVTSETDLTYAWKESADNITYGSALTTTGIYDVATAGTLKVTPTDTSKNGYYYRCTVTNASGSTDTEPVQMTVT